MSQPGPVTRNLPVPPDDVRDRPSARLDDLITAERLWEPVPAGPIPKTAYYAPQPLR
jgi:hypothetical protein